MSCINLVFSVFEITFVLIEQPPPPPPPPPKTKSSDERWGYVEKIPLKIAYQKPLWADSWAVCWCEHLSYFNQDVRILVGVPKVIIYSWVSLCAMKIFQGFYFQKRSKFICKMIRTFDPPPPFFLKPIFISWGHLNEKLGLGNGSAWVTFTKNMLQYTDKKQMKLKISNVCLILGYSVHGLSTYNYDATDLNLNWYLWQLITVQWQNPKPIRELCNSWASPKHESHTVHCCTFLYLQDRVYLNKQFLFLKVPSSFDSWLAKQINLHLFIIIISSLIPCISG